MLKKLLLLLAAIAMHSLASHAQTTVKYTYDDAGNRKYRGIIVLESQLKKGSVDTVGTNEKIKPEVFEDKLGEQKIIIYPNPTKGELRVEIEGYDPAVKSTISIFSLKGSLLQTKALEGPLVEFDLTSYPLGTYILKVMIGKKRSEWKVVKE